MVERPPSQPHQPAHMGAQLSKQAPRTFFVRINDGWPLVPRASSTSVGPGLTHAIPPRAGIDTVSGNRLNGLWTCRARGSRGLEPPGTAILQKDTMRPRLAEECKVLHKRQTAVQLAPFAATLSHHLSLTTQQPIPSKHST